MLENSQVRTCGLLREMRRTLAFLLAVSVPSRYAEVMLFDTWKLTLERCADDVALQDATTGLSHRFADLQLALDQQPALAKGSLHLSSIRDGVLAFVIQTLRAWRDRAVLCPVERECALLPDITGLPSDIVHLKLTSGSTGEPRCVLFRADQLMADALNIKASMKLNATFPNLAIISLAHSYGFSNLALPLLLQGHPMVIVPDALPGSLRAAFALGHRYTLPAVPAMWRAWHQTGLLIEASIALAISAGAPLPIELERAVFEECGLKIHNFYGSSECGGIAYDASDSPRTDGSFAGTAMNQVNLSMNPEGCLVVQSAAAGTGYWPQSDAALAHGRFETSDLVELKSDEVFMRGRVSDAINIAGRKLNPSDVEAAILTCPGVHHCVVFGVASCDSSRCEETVACVNAEANVTSDLLANWLGDRLASWQSPRRFWFSHELSTNERGKIPRRIWKEKFLEHCSGF